MTHSSLLMAQWLIGTFVFVLSTYMICKRNDPMYNAVLNGWHLTDLKHCHGPNADLQVLEAANYYRNVGDCCIVHTEWNNINVYYNNPNCCV